MADLTLYLDQIRNRIILSSIISKDVRLIKKGQEFSGLCPFHSEKTPSFTLNDHKAFYHCFGCGAHGDVISYTMFRQSLPFLEAVKTLAEQAGITLPTFKTEQEPVSQDYSLLEEACQWFEHNLKQSVGYYARDYLEKRGFNKETINFFRLGFAPEKKQHSLSLIEFLKGKGFSKNLILESGLVIKSENNHELYDRFRGRLIFPISDQKGRIIAFGGRILDQGQPKYLNSPETVIFHKGQSLYNYQNAQSHVKKDQPFIVVEGYFDVIALHQAGIKTAVAPLGTAVTSEQLIMLWRRSNQNPIFCFDGDEAGLKAAYRTVSRSLSLINAHQSLNFCYLPKGEDPDSFIHQYGCKEFEKILNFPKLCVDTLWESLIYNNPLSPNSPPENKSAFKKEMVSILNKISDTDIRHFYHQDFNERFYKICYKKKIFERSASRLQSYQSIPLSGTILKKNALAQKILLATVINHPTLLEEVREQLAHLNFEMVQLEQLKQWLLLVEHTQEHSLKQQAIEQGFKLILEEILNKDIYLHAAFAAENINRDIALAGWREVWQRIEGNYQLKKDLKITTKNMKELFDEKTWQKIKLLQKDLST